MYRNMGQHNTTQHNTTTSPFTLHAIRAPGQGCTDVHVGVIPVSFAWQAHTLIREFLLLLALVMKYVGFQARVHYAFLLLPPNVRDIRS